MRRVGLFAAALMALTSVVAADDSNDALAPKTRPEDALVRQLHTATYITHDLDTYRRFYADGLGLELEGPFELAESTRRLQRRLWGIPEEIGYQVYRLHRPSVAGTIQIRLLVLDRETPLMHTSWDAREPGPFSTGYPSTDVVGWDAALREGGHDAMNPMSAYKVPRPDGTQYEIHETIFKAPEFMHAVTISRRDGMAQLGPVDPATGHGGPVYSAQSIADSDAVLAFYTEVLGMELRSDREWKSHGSEGALAVPDGTVFRFSIVYAMGARYGHLLFIDFRDQALPSSGVAPRPPNRGMGIWSFPTADLDEVVARAKRRGTPIAYGPVRYESPTLGTHRVVTLEAPNGFLIEVFESAPVVEFGGAALAGDEIAARAIEAAGGEAWRRPDSLRLSGVATFWNADGEPSYADRYDMWRVFPAQSAAAHQANGKVRIEAFAGDQVLFQTSFDGEHTYDQNGEVPAERAQQEWSSAFGFGILRFALDDGFAVERLVDDQVEGRACHFLRVTDPSGAQTVFGIDAVDYGVRSVGFSTPKGWHERIYSDFEWHESPRFRQPTRVRLYYDGIKTADISWTEYAVDTAIFDEVFRLGSTRSERSP